MLNRLISLTILSFQNKYIYLLHILISFLSFYIMFIPIHVSGQCTFPCSLVWQDEFNGTNIDESKWEFQEGTGAEYGLNGWGNNELQFYLKDNASLQNGKLIITAKYNQYTNSYTSSRMRTKGKAEWIYGRFEMRAKLPSGQGLWPAFWMLPTNSPYGAWAASGEIDIMESKGSDPSNIHGTIHYGDQWPYNEYQGGTFRTNTSTNESFFTYAVEWEPTEIRWYIKDDFGNEYHYKTLDWWYSSNGNYPAPFDSEFHLLLNLAVGGHFDGNPQNNTIFPSALIVDYVRVYQNQANMPDVSEDDNLIILDDMELGSPLSNGWSVFGYQTHGGNLQTNNSKPSSLTGSKSIRIDFGSNPISYNGYIGGFNKDIDYDISSAKAISFWIKPEGGQTYTLKVKISDDDNNNQIFEPEIDEEYQAECIISPNGPCAISGNGWQEVVIPLSLFIKDTSYATGGNGILDTKPNVNGQAIGISFAIIKQSVGSVNFALDNLSIQIQDAYEIPISPINSIFLIFIFASIRQHSAKR
ncbi:MAG: family 16 glycosylhydrolase [Pseudomonadales bacterium]|nr:family 16 glycosylhydrolase [Pseudomonadales bacterium]